MSTPEYDCDPGPHRSLFSVLQPPATHPADPNSRQANLSQGVGKERQEKGRRGLCSSSDHLLPHSRSLPHPAFCSLSLIAGHQASSPFQLSRAWLYLMAGVGAWQGWGSNLISFIFSESPWNSKVTRGKNL